ncbi:MAG: prephenate dehydratase domain-containing protein, partial [Methanobacteriota archaeon]
MKKEIGDLRGRIDEIDDSILSLLEERLSIVRKVGKFKAEKDVAMYDPLREQDILKRLTSATRLDQSFVMRVFREIIAYCRGDEQKIERKDVGGGKTARKTSSSVAVLGPAGTFTENAAKKIFRDTKVTYCENVEDIFRLVEEGSVEHGVVAMENSLEGSVGKTMEALMEYNTSIVGELTLDINLCLMNRKDTEKIDLILSHPHALAQCAGYLKKHYPKARQVSAKSTAQAMKDLSSYENATAIGFKEGAKTYDLNIVAENIQDDFSQTRFIVISKEKVFGGKTSLIFAVED